jgi:hypothetical protein
MRISETTVSVLLSNALWSQMWREHPSRYSRGLSEIRSDGILYWLFDWVLAYIYAHSSWEQSRDSVTTWTRSRANRASYECFWLSQTTFEIRTGDKPPRIVLSRFYDCFSWSVQRGLDRAGWCLNIRNLRRRLTVCIHTPRMESDVARFRKHSAWRMSVLTTMNHRHASDRKRSEHKGKLDWRIAHLPACFPFLKDMIKHIHFLRESTHATKLISLNAELFPNLIRFHDRFRTGCLRCIFWLRWWSQFWFVQNRLPHKIAITWIWI